MSHKISNFALETVELSYVGEFGYVNSPRLIHQTFPHYP